MKEGTPAPDQPAAAAPVAELYPGHAAELAARAAEKSLAAGASAAPLPGALREAFAGEPPTLHGFTFQPVRMRLHVILTRIESPLLSSLRIFQEELVREDGLDESTPEMATAALRERQRRADARIEAQKDDGTAMCETIFCFTRPAREIEDILNGPNGRTHLRELAMEKVGDAVTVPEFMDLKRLAGAWYLASFATRLGFEARPLEGGETTVFTPPPVGTAPAGG